MRNRPSKSDLFKGRHFEQEIIILCVRWYLRYKLSYRDLVEIMAERGLPIAHTTILRWVQRYAPEFDKRRTRFARSAGTSWRVDETYGRIRGRWAYLYRAVDTSARRSTSGLAGGETSPRQRRSFARLCVRSASRPRPSRWMVTQLHIGLFENLSSKVDYLTSRSFARRNT